MRRKETGMQELIYNQKNIPKKQWRYGFRSSAATGCGWIATYNALLLMGYRANPERLIRYYERQAPLLNGNLGTLFFGPAIYFKKNKFLVKMTAKRRKFDDLVKESDACVLFYWWRHKWKFGKHFVTVQYKDGKFTGYNTYSNSKGPDPYGDSLEAFLKRRKYFGAVLIAVNKSA